MALRKMASCFLKRLFHVTLKRAASLHLKWQIHFGDE